MVYLQLPRRWPFSVLLLTLCAPTAWAQEDADARAYAAIRKMGGFAVRDDKRPGRPITHVDFNGFNTGVAFEDQHLRELTPLLVRLKHLESLDLSSFVTDAGIKEVAKLKQLRKLWLCATPITDTGLKKLAGLAKLEFLYLSNDQMTGVGLQHLAGLKDLKKLTLQHVPLTDTGLKALGSLQQLHILDLDGSAVDDAGMKEVARLKHLTWLGLSETIVTDLGIKELTGCKELRVLRLYKTRVTVAAINALQPTLPNCRIEITESTKID
jgi:hypothetical protein